MNNSNNARRTVSIILPTYNRASFLPATFDAIHSQVFQDWELIIVDDGSTDDTIAVVEQSCKNLDRPFRYVRQENQGAYGARNTGLDLATGDYVAFYDSDDFWLPHHLADCVNAFETCPEVDWVYGSCRMVELPSERELAPTTFYENGIPRPFLRLRSRTVGNLRVIEDSQAFTCQLQTGLYCGLQNSVIRRRLFDSHRFIASYRNEAEDQLLVLHALADGCCLAYFDNIHVVYHVHNANSSSAAVSTPLEKRLQIYRAMVRGFEELRGKIRLTRFQERELSRRIAKEYFWSIGYVLLWQNGNRAEALDMFRRALCHWPWDWRCWKTYFGAVLQTYCGLWSQSKLSATSSQGGNSA